MLQNAYFLAKIGADTAENEQHFAPSARGLSARGAFFRRFAAGATSVQHAGLLPCVRKTYPDTSISYHISIRDDVSGP